MAWLVLAQFLLAGLLGQSAPFGYDLAFPPEVWSFHGCIFRPSRTR